MESMYQQNIETSMNKALPDITYYLVCGFILGSVMEYIMPHEYENEKDSVALFLEIFVQLTIIVFAFMFINTRGGTRNGIIVFIIVLVGSQPTLLNKINMLRIKLIGENKKSTHIQSDIEENYNENEQAPSGATSINKLPNSTE